MNRIATKYIQILLGLCLPFGVFTAYAQGVTPTPQASQPIMIFTEMGHAPTSLVFTVNGDATEALAIIRHEKGTNQTLWQDSGTITPSQLDKVFGLQRSLSGAIDQSWRDKDYTFEFPAEDGKTKSLELFNGYQHVDPDMDTTLQKVVQTLLDIRKPFEPLVVFGWSGGFAGRSTQLAIKADGTTSYQDVFRKTIARGKITPSDLETLKGLRAKSTFSAATAPAVGSCNDCWIYSISVLTDKGIETVEVDEVALESASNQIKSLVALLRMVSEQQASLQVTIMPSLMAPDVPITDMPTPTPPSERSRNTINPGDSSRYIGVLGSKDVMVGAAKLLQLRPNEAPTACVVLVFRGPLSYDITLFDGFWLEQKNDISPAPDTLEVLTQQAIATVKEGCGIATVPIIHIP